MKVTFESMCRVTLFGTLCRFFYFSKDISPRGTFLTFAILSIKHSLDETGQFTFLTNKFPLHLCVLFEIDKKFLEELIAYFLWRNMDRIENEKIRGTHRQQSEPISLLTKITLGGRDADTDIKVISQA
jgi:hypothetical protein